MLLAEPGEAEVDAHLLVGGRDEDQVAGRLGSPRARATRSRRRSPPPGPSCRARRGPRPRRRGARPTTGRPSHSAGSASTVSVCESSSEPRPVAGARDPRDEVRPLGHRRVELARDAVLLEVGAQSSAARVSFPGGLTVSRRMSSWRSSATSSRSVAPLRALASVTRAAYFGMGDLFSEAADDAARGAWRRSPRACGRARSTSSSARSRSSARARRCGSRSRRTASARSILYGPPGSGKTTLARIDRAARPAPRSRSSRPCRATVAEVREVIARGPRAARRARPADDPLPRRDPPLQQGAAGRAAARGRGGAADADRRDDREPVLRGQLGAARRAARSTSSSRSPSEDLRGDRRARGAASSAPSVPDELVGADRRAAPAATRGTRSTSSSSPPQTARAEGVPLDERARGGRRAQAAARLRQGRRRALRLHLRVHQVDARLRSRRGRLLPRRDARGRRGPALHRAAHGHPRLRGHRQRRPAARSSSPSRRRTRVEHVGLPEARLNLAQAAIYLALAPKSNAVIDALGEAQTDVREHGNVRPPEALRDAHYSGAQKLGHGQGYIYPHDDPAASTSTTCPSR